MHNATNKVPCDCTSARKESVIAGHWECSHVQCPHRTHVIAFPEHAKSHGDGTYRINATDQDD